MKISYKWLKNYVVTGLDAGEAGKLLTGSGLEVEHIEPFESVKGGLKGLVIGEVKTSIKHPNADKLSLTTVDAGIGKILNIVCGAPNVTAGQKVVVALEGATLFPFVRTDPFGKGEPFTIKKSKIRGEVSEGMICAEDEIGLGASHAGIMVLPADAEAGMPASEYFNIYSDSVFEIGVTPNRADALCHIGVARDLAAAIHLRSGDKANVNFNIPVIKNPAMSPGSGIQVTIQNREACKRYSGAEIRGIEVKESPAWLKNYLSAVGLHPINNIVDIANFVMLETGQPLHAFDADKIKDNKVVVRKAGKGETIVTLDGVERKLNVDDLLICDSSDAMCIAGVYGGKESGVTDNTKNIFLESACFDAIHILRTARNHKLHTDASFRFERGTDANITIYALLRAINLVQEENKNIAVLTVQDVYPVKVEEKKLEFSLSYCHKLCGYVIPAANIAGILEAAGIKIPEKSGDRWMLSIPTYRMDISCAADIVEEILRFYGYNNIPISQRLNIPLVPSKGRSTDELIERAGNFLSSLGFSEVMNTSFTSSTMEENSNSVKIANPLSSDLDVLRSTLLFNGLINIAHNRHNRQPDLKLYEFGRTYHKEQGNYKEKEHLCLWICGNKLPVSWNNKQQPADFYALKSYVNGVIEELTGITEASETILTHDTLFSYGNSFAIQAKEIVKLGMIKREILAKMEIKGDVFFADFNWKALMGQIPGKIEVKEINRFPAVTRDLAMIVDKNVEFSTLKEIARKIDNEILKEISVFDVYEGKNVEKGKKSYALRFILQSDAKTLSDKEIDKVIEKLSKAFTEKAGAVIRSS